MGAHGFVVPSGTGRALPAAGGELLAGAAQTQGAFSLITSHAPLGDRVPRHVHTDADESFYVLTGRYQVECGDDMFTAGAGDFVHLPCGLAHSYVVTEGPASMVILGVPGGLEHFFDDLAAGTDVGELSRRHQVTFLE